MTKIEKVIREIIDLYDFNQKLGRLKTKQFAKKNLQHAKMKNKTEHHSNTGKTIENGSVE